VIFFFFGSQKVMLDVDDFVDYYALLQVDFSSSEREIEKAFRKKALTCHPDKVGPEDKEAGND
jgi:curved DNA-binding protein CbpA